MADKISLGRMDQLLRAVFRQLKSVGGRARPKSLFAELSHSVDLSPYELERTSSGAVRWETHVRFYLIGCKRAGFLQSESGYWKLTPEGERALTLPEGQLVRSANERYREWRSSLPNPDQMDSREATEERSSIEVDAAERLTLYQEAVETAGAEIEAHILKLGPYEFQDLVAELLRGMGYHVPLVADPGPDGGVDVTAYKDPLGMSAPRLKVQVKHRDSKVGAKEVRELEGVLRKDGDIGLIVSSGGFTGEAIREIRSSTKHIETLDLDRVIALWQEHYAQISETGRRLLPLATVHFLAPSEERST